MALVSNIINIDAFDADVSASGQQTVKVRVKNRIQKTVANSLYSISFLS